MDHTNNSCCCDEAEHFSGCLICGASITYRAESSIQTCSICHKEQLTNAVCENGHFICDACHSYGTYAPVITTLRDSTEKDALLLLEKIMDLPSVHMHGPEHHAIVPCVLLTAFRNNGEHMDYDAALSEICKRAKQVPGGTCGYWGCLWSCCRSRYFHVRYDWIQSTSQRCMAVSSKTCFHYFIQTGRCWWTSLLQTYQQNCH